MMTFASLLLCSMLLPAPGGQTQPVQALVNGSNNAVTSPGEAIPAQSFQLEPSKPVADGLLTPTDDMCYKIRAYIFKRDDDHAPKFVRSTTCGPGRPHAKDATWPKAKVVPAN
jgi:hypothetical protein